MQKKPEVSLKRSAFSLLKHMKIAIGCDHAGFPYKDGIIAMLQSQGHMVLDFGTKIAEGTPQAIKTNPDVIKAYLGAVA